MKYDQSVIDNTLDEAIMLYRQGKMEKGSHLALLSIAMMMRNTLDNEIIEVFTDPRPSDGYR